MTKFRLRLKSGRVVGPFDLSQLKEVHAKGHIKGDEEAQVFPAGDWAPISTFDFYSELSNLENKGKVANEYSYRDETFVIDINKIRNHKQELEIAELGSPQIMPIEALTETVRISSSEKNARIEKEIESVNEPLQSKTPAPPELEKTLINPVAQEELEKMRRLNKVKKSQETLVEEVAEPPAVLEEIKNFEMVSTHEETQVFKFDKRELITSAQKGEQEIEDELRAITLSTLEERRLAQHSNDEEELEVKPSKKRPLILIIAAVAFFIVILFPDEKKSKDDFVPLLPQIQFPVPYDQLDEKKSKVEYEAGLKLFIEGTYPSIIKSGLRFKNAYENDVENVNALSFLVRSYGEQLKSSKNLAADAQVIFKMIQGKKVFLTQNPNGVVGLNLFYMAIEKYDAAVDVVMRYLKYKPKEVTEDLFAVLILSLIEQSRIDLAKPFYQSLLKAPNKTRLAYSALIEYYILNQEFDKAEKLVDEAIAELPQISYFYLMKAELASRNQNYVDVAKWLQKAKELNLESSDLNRSKYFELKGLMLAYEKKTNEATSLFTRSLEIKDSVQLRQKLASLKLGDGTEEKTQNLINESKAIKFLIEANYFFNRKDYETALSKAARATDAYPGHIPAELFLAKAQFKLGLYSQGLKTMDALALKFPEDKKIIISYTESLIDAYKFNDARNRLQGLSTTDLKNTWEFASTNAKLNLKMGDSLQAMSWLITSININPLNDQDIFLLSEILQKKSNFNGAKDLLNKCIDLDPVNPDYRIAYARLIYESQDDQAAIGYLLNLQNEFGENPKILSEIATFYFRAGKVKDFQGVKEKLEKTYPNEKSLYEFLIKAALLDERTKDIPLLVETLLKIEPNDLQQMMTAGRVLYEEGKLVEAAKWFKRVHDKLPSFPKVLYYIAKIDFLSKDYDGAIKKLQKDMLENGENDQDLVFLAEINMVREQYVEAENLLKRAQKINPKSFDAIVGLADLSTKRNNHDLALDLYKRAIKLRPEEAILNKKIGDVYRQIGQGTLAIEAYKLYLEMEPESSDKNNLEAYINLMK